MIEVEQRVVLKVIERERTGAGLAQADGRGRPTGSNRAKDQSLSARTSGGDILVKRNRGCRINGRNEGVARNIGAGNRHTHEHAGRRSDTGDRWRVLRKHTRPEVTNGGECGRCIENQRLTRDDIDAARSID